MQDTITRRDRARFVPAAPAGSVSRKRLDDVYSDAVGRVVRVVAPGGYGKTTQVARWVEGDRRHVGWVDVERVDNDPAVLLEALGGALAGPGGLDIGGLPRGPRDPDDFIATVVPEFGTLVRSCRLPFSLVLDDVHNVDAPPSLAVLDALAANLPPGSTLVLSGRTFPGDDSIARLRLHPGVIDVALDDLMLEPAEAEELLSKMGVAITSDELHGLATRFEGWPAGLRLAGLALRSGGDPSWITPADAGDAVFVTDYLRAEWTGSLDADARRFLLEAACLDRFTGRMCDEILGSGGSTAMLRRLHRGDLVVLPLDRRDEWFRMHPLLAKWLASELEATDVRRWTAVHLAASNWWAAGGDIDLAFDHALTVGDVAACESLVGAHGGTYLVRGMHATVSRWLSAFPTEYVLSSPTLCALASQVAAQHGHGDQALRWARAVARLIDDERDRAVPLEFARQADVMRAAFEPEPAADLVELAERARRQLEPGPWRALACWVLGGLHFLAGDDAAGTAALDEGAFEAEVLGAPTLWANCLATGAALADLRDDREKAELAGRRADEILRLHRLDDLRTTVLVTAVKVLLDARAGRVDSARRGLETARRDLSGLTPVAPWLNVLCRLVLVRACLLIDDRGTCRTLLDEAQRHLRHEPADNGAAAHLADARTKVDATAQLVPTGSAALTSAELNVIRFLPTNLSLGDIATRLYVSRNTVKSHVAAIYRKLGVSTRAEAVDVARGAGLLDLGGT